MAEALPCDGVRVRLRRLRADDLPAFHACRSNAELARYQGWQPMDAAAAAAFIAEMAAVPFCPPGAWCQLAIADLASDGLLGDIGLHLAEDGATLEIGYTLVRAAQGAGRAGEAVRLALAAVFAHTAATRVRAVTDVRNTPSVRLLQRLGFSLLATQDTLFRGQPCREHVFVFERPALACAS
jgi:RimJ/RimL family protein N-acetyltransferase